MAGGQLGRRGWRWRGQEGAAAAAALLLASLASGRPAALQAAFVPPAPVMAAGAPAAWWSFHETFEAKLRAVVLANVRSMHRPDIVRDAERIDSLTADAAMVIFDRAAGWKPGGAKPWNWAARAIRSMIAAEIGHRQVELGNDDTLRGEAGSAPVMSDAAPAAEQKKEAVRAQSCAL